MNIFQHALCVLGYAVTSWCALKVKNNTVGLLLYAAACALFAIGMLP